MSTTTATRSTVTLTAITAITPIVWGTTYIVTTELLPPDRPLFSGLIRALPAGLILLAWRRELPHGHWWWRSALLGVLNIGAFFALLFVAAYRLPGGVAATLGAAQPLVVAGLSPLLLSILPTKRHLAAGSLGITGVGLMVLTGDAAFDTIGIVAGLTGTASMATGVLLTKRWGRPTGVLAFTSWQLIAGGAFLLPIALALEGPPPTFTLTAIAGYAWLGLIGTVLAYALWFRGIQALPVGPVSFLPLLSPITAAALGWAILGQSLTPTQTVGFAIALAAVLLAQHSPRRPVGPSPEPQKGRRLLHEGRPSADR